MQKLTSNKRMNKHLVYRDQVQGLKPVGPKKIYRQQWLSLWP